MRLQLISHIFSVIQLCNVETEAYIIMTDWLPVCFDCRAKFWGDSDKNDTKYSVLKLGIIRDIQKKYATFVDITASETKRNNLTADEVNCLSVSLIIVLIKRRNSSVGTVAGYGREDRMIGIRIPAGAGKFSLRHRVQNGSGAHPASYPTGTGGTFSGLKRPGSELDHSHPFIVEVEECVELYRHSPNTSSWRGA
jgi:hypothetical protein